MFDELCRFRRIYVQNARGIGELFEPRILENVLQMTECLNAGKQLNTELKTKIVKFTDFVFGIASAPESDKRHVRDFERVFGIEREMGQAEQGEACGGAFQERNGRDGTAGTVEHQSAFRECGFHRSSGRYARQNGSEQSVKHGTGCITDAEAAGGSADGILIRTFAQNGRSLRFGKKVRQNGTEKRIVQADHGHSRL